MRLIDADNVDYENIMCSQQQLHWLFAIIEEQPTVDAVQVVRCKECLFAEELTERDKQIYYEGCVMCQAINPFGNKVPMVKDGYCNIGMRKDGADNEK